MPTIAELEEENGENIVVRDVITPDIGRPQEQLTDKQKGEAGSIPVVEPILEEQEQSIEEDGQYFS